MKFDSPTADEFPLIFDSWARCWMKSPYAGCVRNCDWDQISRATASEIIDRPTTRVTVLVTETEDGSRRVAGYSVSEPERAIVHWIYVKRDFRGMGLGLRLLNEVKAQGAHQNSKWAYTHRTNACERFFRGMKWDPVPARVKA